MKARPLFTHLFFFFVFCFPQIAGAQEETPPLWLFSGATVQLGASPAGIRYGANGNRFYEQERYNRLNPGLGIRKTFQKDNFAELGLTHLYFRERDESLRDSSFGVAVPIQGSFERNYGAAFRLQFGKVLAPGPEARWQPALGLSLDPWFDYYRYVPKTSVGFPYRSIQVGAELRFIPQLLYRCSERVAFNAALPLRFAGFHFEHALLENPLFTENQQSTQTMNLDTGLGGLQLQAGVLVRLN